MPMEENRQTTDLSDFAAGRCDSKERAETVKRLAENPELIPHALTTIRHEALRQMGIDPDTDPLADRL